MGKYRKRPVVIEAFRLGAHSWPDWFHDRVSACDITTHEAPRVKGLPYGISAEIKTLEGVMTADCGDWIIKGVAGEIYPCKPDIFDATYERVSPTPSHHIGG